MSKTKKSVMQSQDQSVGSSTLHILDHTKGAHHSLNFGHLAESFIEKAKESYAQGKLSQAINEYEKVAQSFLAHPKKTVAQANALLQARIEQGKLSAEIKQYDQAISYYDQALELANNQIVDQQLIAFGYIKRGIAYQQLEDWNNAKPDFQNALALFEALEEQHSPALFGFTLYQIAMSSHRVGEYASARSYYKKCIDFHQSYYDKGELLDIQEWSLAYINLAKINEEEGLWDQALQLYQTAIALMLEAKAQGKEIHQESYFVAALNRASIHYQFSAFEYSIEGCSEILSLCDTSKDQDICLLQALNLRALAYWQEQKYDLAAEDYQSAIKLYKSHLEAGERKEGEMAQSWVNLAQMNMIQGQYELAYTHFDEALKYYERLLKTHCLASPHDYVVAFLGQANAAHAQHKHQDALNSLKKAQVLMKRYKKESGLLAQILMNRGGILQAQGNTETALEHYKKVIDLLPEPEGKIEAESPWVQAHYLTGFILALEQGNPKQAISHFEIIEAHCPALASYDLACLYCGLGDSDVGINWLYRHFQSHYRVSHEQVLNDSDLNPLHDMPLWEQMMSTWPVAQ